MHQTETTSSNACRHELSCEVVFRCHVHVCPIEVMDYDEYLSTQHNVLYLPSHSSIFQHQLHYVDAVQNSQVLSFHIAREYFVQ
jgi:hypothetical protein